MNGIIDSPDMLELFGLICPKPGLRSTRLANTIKTTKKYVDQGPHNRLSNLVNIYCDTINYFGDTIKCFKNNIKKVILKY